MAGTFSLTARPKRSGAYFNWIARQQEPVLASTAGSVAVAFTHDWGPAETIVELESWGEFLDIFGDGNAPAVLTDGYKAVRQVFQGEGLPSSGGAGRVLAFRMVGASGAPATRAITGVASAAITLNAKYPGTFGNRLWYYIETNAKDNLQDDLVILVDATEVERWTYVKGTGITGLQARLNDAVTGSGWVSATGAVNGTNLTPATLANKVQLQGGNDGSALLAADYTAWQAALDAQRFSLLVASNLIDVPDNTVRLSMQSWVNTRNLKGKRTMLVLGGQLDEVIATAVTRSGSAASPNVVNIGVGSVRDETLGVLSTAQLAPRIAGILANFGETRGLTFARLAGVTIVVGPSDSAIETGIDGGVITLGQDSHPTAPVRLEKQVTTFTSTTDPDRPYKVYSVPKFVRVQHSIETELTEWAEQNVIGKMPVNDGTRAYVRGQTEARLRPREAIGAIQPGWTVRIATQPAPTDSDDFVAITFEIGYGRDVEQVLNTVIVS